MAPLCSCTCPKCEECIYKTPDGPREPITPSYHSNTPRHVVTKPKKKLRFIMDERMSASKRAGLDFSVSKARSVLRKTDSYKMKVGVGAAINAAATVEYLVREILDAAMDEAREAKKKRISPRHVKLAIEKDEDLKQLCGSKTIFPGGGVLPKVALMSKRIKV